MWKIKQLDSREFLVNLEYDGVDAVQRIYITDLRCLWSAELTDNEILDIFKKFNPLIEAEAEKLKCEIRRMLDAERTDVHWTVEMQDDRLQLDIKTTASWTPLNFQLSLAVTDNTSYFQTIVLPLLIVIRNNQKQIDYLCDIIKKKDLEIEEYKMNGAVLTRKAVITPKFDQNVLNNVFEKNLETVSASGRENYLDSTIERYYNQVGRVDYEKNKIPVIADVLKSEQKISSDTEPVDIQQKPKEDTLDIDSRIEGNLNEISPMPKPIFRRKPKTVKKLKNL